MVSVLGSFVRPCQIIVSTTDRTERPEKQNNLGIPVDLGKRRYPPPDSGQVSRNRGYLTAHRRGHVRPQQPGPDVVGLDDAARR